MVLTRSQYENMSKEELIQELTDINSRFFNDINAKLTGLSEKFNGFTSKYDKVYSELQQCKSFNSHLLTRIIQLERNAVTNSQYSRREATELNLVLTEIHEDILEESICKALSLTGVKLFLSESMSNENQQLAYKYRQLKSARKIHSTWFFNNAVNIKLTEHGGINKIFHVTDIENLLEIENLEEYINNASF